MDRRTDGHKYLKSSFATKRIYLYKQFIDMKMYVIKYPEHKKKYLFWLTKIKTQECENPANTMITITDCSNQLFYTG